MSQQDLLSDILIFETGVCGAGNSFDYQKPSLWRLITKQQLVINNQGKKMLVFSTVQADSQNRLNWTVAMIKGEWRVVCCDSLLTVEAQL